MDLYGDDIDTLLESDELNVNIQEEDEAIVDDDEDGEKKDDGERVVVEPKKRAVRNPQVDNPN